MEAAATGARARGRVHELGLVYCATIWGATFYVVKDALAAVDATTLVAYRFLLASAVLLPWALPRLKRGWVLKEGAILGAFLAASYLTQTIGLRYTSASSSGFITGLFVLFVPVFLLLFLGSPPSGAQWAATALALAGLWLLTGGPGQFNQGDGLTVLTAMAYAAHVLATDRFVKTDADPIVLAFHQFWITGVGSLALALATGAPLRVDLVAAGGPILFLTLFPTLSAFVTQMVCQRHVTPVTATLIFVLEPVFAALFAWTLGGEVFVPARAAGGGLVVGAMLLGELSRRMPAKDAPAAPEGQP